MYVLASFFSGPDMLIIGFIFLVLFGSRMPSVMRNLGKGVTEFKKGVAGIEDDEAPQDTARKVQEAPKTPEQRRLIAISNGRQCGWPRRADAMVSPSRPTLQNA